MTLEELGTLKRDSQYQLGNPLSALSATAPRDKGDTNFTLDTRVNTKIAVTSITFLNQFFIATSHYSNSLPKKKKYKNTKIKVVRWGEENERNCVLQQSEMGVNEARDGKKKSAELICNCSAPHVCC